MQESFYDFLKQRSAGVETPGQPKSFYEHLEMQKAKASMPYVERGIQDVGQMAKQAIQPLATLASMVAEAPQPKPKKPESFLEHLQLVSGKARSWQPTQPPEQPAMPTMGPMTPGLERKQQEFMEQATPPTGKQEGVVYGEGGIWTGSPAAYQIGEKVAERAPMYLISPTAGLMFEGITQAKNIIVPLVEKSRYDITAQKMLTDLLPEDTAPWLRTALTTGEMGVDMLIAGFGLRKAAEVPGKILRDTFKNIYAKAKAAGYTQEQLDKVKALADKFIKPGTIKEEIARNIKARRGKVKAPKGKRLQEPMPEKPTLPAKTTEPTPPKFTYEDALQTASEGGTLQTKQILKDAISREPRKILNLQKKIRQREGDTLTLYRVTRGRKMEGIESFTTDINIAKKMGTYNTMKVPVESIVGHSKYQPKYMRRSLAEKEVLVDITKTAGKPEVTPPKVEPTKPPRKGYEGMEEATAGEIEYYAQEFIDRLNKIPERNTRQRRNYESLIREKTSSLSKSEREGANLALERLRGVEPIIEKPLLKEDQVVDGYYNDVVADLKKEKKGGFIKITPKDKKAKFSDKQVERAVSTTRFPVNEVQAIKEKGARMKHGFKNVFEYEHTLKDVPKFKNDVRLFQDVPWDAFLDAQKKTLATVGKLDRAEYKTLEKYIALKSFESRLNAELAVPLDLSLNQVQKALSEIEVALTPKIREAVERHLNIVELERQDLIAREKIDPEVGVDFYFPHQVIEYSPIWTSWRGMPKKFKKPFREYLVKRVGSKKPIEINYINAMTDHYTKVFLDNAIDDFMEASVKEWDIAEGMSKADKKLHFGKDGQPQPRLTYEIGGKKYQGFQYEKGQVIYPAKTINEKLFQQAVMEDLTVPEFLEMEGPKGGKPIRDALALGKRHKVSVLPKEIAERLESFRSPSGDLPGFWAMRDFMSWWKRMTLDFAGLPFQMQNLFGDSLNLYKSDPAAFTKNAEAAQIMIRQAYKPEHLTESQQAFLKSAQKQRVTTTHMFRETGMGGLESRKLKQLRSGTWNPVNWVGEIFYQIEKFSMTREGINRLASYMKNLERIEKGEVIVASEVDIAGIEPIAAAGKVSREFTVDYGAVSPTYKKFLRGVLAPFLTFYDYNARNWFKYFKKHPVKSILKFGVPTAAVWTWNNTGDRKDIEKDLGFWKHVPHLITGYKTKDGKPIIVAFQTPFDMALSWFGLDKIPAKITDIKSGKMTWAEAAIEQIKDSTYRGAPGVAYRLLNPFIQGLVGLATNRDPYTRKEVVPSRFQGTEFEKNYIGEYIASKVFTPIAQYMRIANEMKYTPELGKYGAWLLKGPVDYLRAFGIREVDLDQNKMIEGYETKAELTAEVNNKLAIAERAWVKAFLMPDEKEAEVYLKGVWKKLGEMDGPNPTNEQLINRLYHNRTQIEIITRLIQKTKDPDLRDEMKEYLTMLKRQRYSESMSKYSIKAIRPYLFKSLGEIHK